MSNPEIARRCLQCGASVRAGARFCPQCGTPVENLKATRNISTEQKVDSGSENKSAKANEVKLASTEPIKQTRTPGSTGIEAGSNSSASASVSERPQSNIGLSPDMNSRSGRVVALSTDDGGLLPKVEKLRQVSSVMLDEAAVDPSLRFILVAAFLFIVFIILLILNQILK